MTVLLCALCMWLGRVGGQPVGCRRFSAKWVSNISENESQFLKICPSVLSMCLQVYDEILWYFSFVYSNQLWVKRHPVWFEGVFWCGGSNNSLDGWGSVDLKLGQNDLGRVSTEPSGSRGRVRHLTRDAAPVHPGYTRKRGLSFFPCFPLLALSHSFLISCFFLPLSIWIVYPGFKTVSHISSVYCESLWSPWGERTLQTRSGVGGDE